MIITPNKNHIYKLLTFLYEEVLSAGGDGDALWYIKYYDIKDIEDIVKEYNDDFGIGWKVDSNSEGGGVMISWGNNQEWVIITNNFETFDKSPDWIQIKIQY